MSDHVFEGLKNSPVRLIKSPNTEPSYLDELFGSEGLGPSMTPFMEGMSPESPKITSFRVGEGPNHSVFASALQAFNVTHHHDLEQQLQALQASQSTGANPRPMFDTELWPYETVAQDGKFEDDTGRHIGFYSPAARKVRLKLRPCPPPHPRPLPLR
jgi:hypothetical protein